MWDVLTPAHKTAPCSMRAAYALVAPDVEVDLVTNKSLYNQSSPKAREFVAYIFSTDLLIMGARTSKSG